MTQKQIIKLLRSKGYHFSKIFFPFGSYGNNTLFWLMGSCYSIPLYFTLILEGNYGLNGGEYFLFQITHDSYKKLCSKFYK